MEIIKTTIWDSDEYKDEKAFYYPMNDEGFKANERYAKMLVSRLLKEHEVDYMKIELSRDKEALDMADDRCLWICDIADQDSDYKLHINCKPILLGSTEFELDPIEYYN